MAIWEIDLLNPETGEKLLHKVEKDISKIVEEVNALLKESKCAERIKPQDIYDLSSPFTRKRRATFVEKTEKWLKISKVFSYQQDSE
jgi:6-phosphogluconate dehydrogenase